MKTNLTFILSILFIPILISAQNEIKIIPNPQQIEVGEGFFTFSNTTELIYNYKNKELTTALSPLFLKLNTSAGIKLKASKYKNKGNIITVSLSDKITNDEGYELKVNPNEIIILAKKPSGVFYAVQSLLQLLPIEIECCTIIKNIDWKIPCVSITDAPAFGYRGIMLDVARHYMPYEFLKKLIDLLSMQKMNVLHLHLTDSQGWRFESKKYPKLTQIGAFRKGTPLNLTYDYNSRPNDTLYGGFYTQKQLKELVAYANSKFITIIPEIEMPAHSKSVLASYPNLACLDSSGKPFAYPSNIQDEYCTKDSTFIFLTNILTEVMDIFPSKIIHIGGDEAGKENWKKCPVCAKRMKDEHLASVDELQSYFIKRIEKFVNEKNRTVIGWDEILEGGLAPNAIVMSWRGEQGGIDAIKQNHKVVMTPGSYCYLDHYQSEDASEPTAWGGLTTLSKVYSYNPIPAELNTKQAKLILGAQGNLWTEFVPNSKQAEYMIFPRSIALAEVTWSNKKQEYSDFISRLLPYLKRLDQFNVNYSRHLFDIKMKTYVDSTSNQIMAKVIGIPDNYLVFYTTNGSVPTKNDRKYIGPIPISNSTILTVGALYQDIMVDKIQKTFSINKATGKPSELKTEPSKYYNKGGNQAWNNGVLGSNSRFNDDEWLAWSGQDFEGTIDFQKTEILNVVKIRFFNKPSSWVYLPSKVSLFVSDDGIHFKEIESKSNFDFSLDGVQEISFQTKGIKANYIKIIATFYGDIPKGNPGEGTPAWLFVDEVSIE